MLYVASAQIAAGQIAGGKFTVRKGTVLKRRVAQISVLKLYIREDGACSGYAFEGRSLKVALLEVVMADSSQSVISAKIGILSSRERGPKL